MSKYFIGFVSESETQHASCKFVCFVQFVVRSYAAWKKIHEMHEIHGITAYCPLPTAYCPLPTPSDVGTGIAM